MTSPSPSPWALQPMPLPADLDAPDAWAIHGAAAVSLGVEIDRYGHDDLASRPAQILGALRNRFTRTTEVVAMRAGAAPAPDSVVGCAYASLPLTSNPHLAYVGVEVHPAHRGLGAGGALLAEVERLATDEGRTSLVAWTEQVGEPDAGSADALVPPTGSGLVRASEPGVRLARKAGYALEQAERYSVLHLPVAPELLQTLHDDAAARAGDGYRLHTWSGETPELHVAAMAMLQTRMSADIPTADLDMDEDPWDADRVREEEARVAAAGHGSLTTVAEHVATGDLVAYSRLMFPLDRPEAAHQEDTLVLSAHRGHRLGMLLKTRQLIRFAQERPSTLRIHTWNAEENAHMLAINVALGFRPTGVVGMWQKRVG